MPSRTVWAGTGSQGFGGAGPVAWHEAQSRRSAAVNSAPCRSSPSGMSRMITDDVSRWIRSCSIPMRISQAGEFHVIGSSSGIDSMKPSTSSRTAAR